MTASEPRTLDQRLAEGKLPASAALHAATSLAAALRKLHDQGCVHGALTPDCLELTASGVGLLPARTRQGAPEVAATPYTAPEVLRGQTVDARSDIYSFGAVVYQMITGRPPFEDSTPEALATAILHTQASATGNPAIDGLLANCLAKDPETRWQRMQKVQMGLRLLTGSVRRDEGPPPRADVGALIRKEVQDALDSRMSARLEAQETTLAELRQTVTASLQAMQAHLCTIDTKLSAADQRLVTCEEPAARLSGIEQTLASQRDTLEGIRRTMAQTDDLVERVVEALDSLETLVLERSEERPCLG